MNFNLKGNNNTHTHKKEVILNLQITTTHIKHKKNEFQLGSINNTHTKNTKKMNFNLEASTYNTHTKRGCRLLDYW